LVLCMALCCADNAAATCTSWLLVGSSICRIDCHDTVPHCSMPLAVSVWLLLGRSVDCTASHCCPVQRMLAGMFRMHLCSWLGCHFDNWCMHNPPGTPSTHGAQSFHCWNQPWRIAKLLLRVHVVWTCNF
jgi:hypothetical protein